MPEVSTDRQKIREALTRGVERIYPSREALEKTLLSGKRLKIYNGIDPTGRLHIGHGVVLKKLRQFQDLGHEIIVLIGDFTARIGDPTDKPATRKQLTRAEVKRNSRGYKKLIGKILDLKSANLRFLHNEQWSNKLRPEDMLELASYFTVSRLLERDMFQNRIKEGKDIRVHEFLYPIFQAYDSVSMGVDMEIGGNDQTFNMLAGRTLLKRMKNKEKFVLTTKLLTDPGGKKMGKTTGNMVNLDDSAETMYGKLMSIPDDLTAHYLELATDVPAGERTGGRGAGARDLKMRLAREVVTLYHGARAALAAEAAFVRLFREKAVPADRPTVEVPRNLNVLQLVVAAGAAGTASEAGRLMAQGGIKIDGREVRDPRAALPEADEITISRGKRFFRRVRFTRS